MDIPFTSLRAFQEGFLLYFHHYKEKFSNAREVDFLHELKRKYIFWTRITNGKREFNDLIWIQEFSYSEYKGFSHDQDEITISLFAYIVDSYFNYYMPLVENPFNYFPYSPFNDDDKFIKDYKGEDIKETPTEHLFSLIENERKENNNFKKPDDYKSTHKKYLLSKSCHLDYFEFLYYENNEIKADEHKFKDFGFAITSILDEIEERIADFNTPKKISTNNYKDINEEQENKISLPQKIKILDQLNIVGFLQKKGITKTNTEKLLAELFNVSYKTIQNNLKNTLHEDFAKNKIEEYKNKPSKRD